VLYAATASTTPDSTAGAQGTTYTFQKLARKKERKKEKRAWQPPFGAFDLVTR
jgi:hypothetical protein